MYVLYVCTVCMYVLYVRYVLYAYMYCMYVCIAIYHGSGLRPGHVERVPTEGAAIHGEQGNLT